MLSKQAQALIDDFKQRISDLPKEERAAVIKKMTESIAALNTSVGRALDVVQGARDDKAPDGTYDVDHLRDFI